MATSVRFASPKRHMPPCQPSVSSPVRRVSVALSRTLQLPEYWVHTRHDARDTAFINACRWGQVNIPTGIPKTL